MENTPQKLTGETIPPLKDLVPRDYQEWAYNAIAKNIRDYKGAFFIEASVGAGKTAIMAMILSQAQEKGIPCLVLARRGELVEQNSETFWSAGVRNSIFSASMNIKSTKYPIIVGSEGTVARSIDGQLKDFKPSILLLDECHELAFDQDDSQYMKIISELLQRQPKLRIIGLTGSPYRGTKDILGEFWRLCAYRVRTPYLVDNGYLVPTIFGFGHDEVRYDLSQFKISDEDNHSDYTKEELLAMQKIITKDKTTTQLIVEEVIALTKNRNVVMITGAGKKHLEQIAECLPENSWIIITDDTSARERRAGLKSAYDGEKKFILQIGCLTTGIDMPLIDTSVIMRKIGSLTLLVQLLGRGMRLLKPFQKEKGYKKEDHLVLDYSGTMDEMNEIYLDPVLERAAYDKAKQDNVDMVICGLCGQGNSPTARRCIGNIKDNQGKFYPVVRTDKNNKQWKNFEIDGRCENFYKMRECNVCGTPNDTAARECRLCEAILIDPNKNLTNRHYVDADYRKVNTWTMGLTRNQQGIIVSYFIEGIENQNAKTFNMRGVQCEVATELLFPESREKWMKSKWYDFLNTHTKKEHRPLFSGRRAIECLKLMRYMQPPTHITHRINADGRSIIHRKKFIDLDVAPIETEHEKSDTQDLAESLY